MTEMGDVDRKVDGMTSRVDDAVKITREAKDSVKLVEVKFGKLPGGGVDNMQEQVALNKKDMKSWQADMEKKINGVQERRGRYRAERNGRKCGHARKTRRNRKDSR